MHWPDLLYLLRDLCLWGAPYEAARVHHAPRQFGSRVAAHGAPATGRARAAHRSALLARRRRSRSTGAPRGVPAGIAGMGLDHRPQRADRLTEADFTQAWMECEMNKHEAWQLTREAAELYERYVARYILAPWAPLLVDGARLAEGERVLDVACGTGVVTHAAAKRVGPSGHVVGVDLNPGMVAVARSLPAPAGAPIEL